MEVKGSSAGSHGPKAGPSAARFSASRFLSQRWEILFFLLAFILLTLQVLFFCIDVRSLSSLGRAIAVFAAIDSFIINRLSYVATPGFLLPLIFLLFQPVQSGWARRYLDLLGIYIVTRMGIQLVGLNVLVFDTVSSRFFLITQLLFFLPYSLLVWGWIYWRLDQRRQRNMCAGKNPVPAHGLVIYDVMGLTLSSAISLVQSQGS